MIVKPFPPIMLLFYRIASGIKICWDEVSMTKKRNTILLIVAAFLLVFTAVALGAKKADGPERKIVQFLPLIYNCPDEEVVTISISATPEERLEYAKDLIDGLVAPEYDSVLITLHYYQLRCAEEGSSMKIETLTTSLEDGSKDVWQYQLLLLCTNPNGIQSQIQTSGTIRFNEAGLIENFNPHDSRDLLFAITADE